MFIKIVKMSTYYRLRITASDPRRGPINFYCHIPLNKDEAESLVESLSNYNNLEVDND